jgi:signal peptidase I
MLPTLKENDKVLVLKVSLPTWLYRGQILLIDSSGLNGLPLSRLILKRAIGLPGDKIETVLAYQHKRGVGNLNPKSSIQLPSQIPEKHIFIVGDNPNGSADSFYFGPIPQHSVKGIVIWVFS